MMKLEQPLATLIARCEALCVAGCCGIDAYDFSPIHIAAFLIAFRGKPDLSEVRLVRNQIEVLRRNYGISGSSGRGVVIEEMNQEFTAEQVEELANELLANLEVALTLAEKGEVTRYRKTATN